MRLSAANSRTGSVHGRRLCALALVAATLQTGAFAGPFPTIAKSPVAERVVVSKERFDRAVAWRGKFGLAIDENSVDSVLQARRVSKYGTLVTPAEEADLDERLDLQSRLEPALEYVMRRQHDFAGAYIDQTGGFVQLTVMLATASTAESVSHLESLLPDDARIKYRHAARSSAHLGVLQQSLQEAAIEQSLVINDLHVDIKQNQVVFSVPGWRQSAVAQLVASEPSAFRAESTGPGSPVSCDAITTCTPWRGGMRTTGDTQPGSCTAGFNARPRAEDGNASVRYVLTAGHCATSHNQFLDFKWKEPITTTFMDPEGNTMGVGERNSYSDTSATSDSVRIPVSITDLGAAQNTIFTPADPLHQITNAASLAQQVPGFGPICSFGAKTYAITHYEVSDLDPCGDTEYLGTREMALGNGPFPSHLMVSFVHTSILATGGDSGGPVYAGNTAFGIVSFKSGLPLEHTVNDPTGNPYKDTDDSYVFWGEMEYSMVSRVTTDTQVDLCLTASCDVPTANFTSATSPTSPLTVAFTDTSSDGSEWLWLFGDGGFSNAQNPDHRYSSPGAYTVTLQVTNRYGPSQATSRIVIGEPDATGWTPGTAGVGTADIFGLATDQQTWVIAGESGKVASTQAPYGTWTPSTSSFGASAINAVAYGGGKWVAVGGSGKLATSPDSASWTPRTSGFGTTAINAVAYGDGYWVAVGASGKLATSPDGETWTPRTSGFGTSAIYAVAYGDGVWTIVGGGGKIATADPTATDPPTSWTPCTASNECTASFGSTNIRGLAYENDTWVAVADSGKIATSTSPATLWMQRTSPVSTSLRAVAFGDDTWVAGGDSGKIITSTTPTGTWSETSLAVPATDSIRAISHDGTWWAAAATNGHLWLATDPSTGYTPGLVTACGDWGVGSLRAAVDAAANDSTITFARDCTGPSRIIMSSPIITDKAIAIDGTGHSVTLDGGGTSQILVFTGANEHAINALTLQNGYDDGSHGTQSGGAVSNYSASNGWLYITNSTITGSQATGTTYKGGGVGNYHSTVYITDSNVVDNTGGFGVAGFYGHIYVTRSTVSGNADGGVWEKDLSNGGGLDITDSTISDNDGVGVYAYGSTNTISGTTVSDNNGRGVYLTFGTTTITDSMVTGNGDGTGSGGGITTNSAVLHLLRTAVEGNSAASGGGIYNYGGAGVAPIDLSESTISGNTGRGLDGAGAFAIIDSTISGNAGGGGSLASGSSVDRSTIANNYGASSGGGLSGSFTISNSTVYGNSATSSGGGLYAGSGSAITATNITVTGNYAPVGGGVRRYSGTVNFSNSIVSGNTADDASTNCYGAVTDLGFNLEYGSSTCSFDITGDPMLGSLTDNGGPTKTVAIGAGSAAIGAGSASTCLATPVLALDQRGEFRNAGTRGVCDIGAYDTGL